MQSIVKAITRAWQHPPIDANDDAFAAWQPDAADTYCSRCGASVGRFAQTAQGCSYCLKDAQPWTAITRLSAYADPMRPWILDMKFKQCWSWARWLGWNLAEQLPAELSGDNIAVCHVPMHWRRRWRRGFNQSQIMARAIASKRKWLDLPVLYRPKATRPQTMVRRTDRWPNVRDSFSCHPIDLTNWRIVLVDDVKTTGSTLRACAKLLHEAGADAVYVAVAAVGDPHDIDVTRSP